MLYADCYQTKVGRVFNTKPIENAIKEAIIKDGINTNTLNVDNKGTFKPIYILGFYPSELEIPLFTHPISILNINHNNYLCTDLRLYIRKDIHDSFDRFNIEKSIKNITEYNFVKSRSILSLLWLNNQVDYIKNNTQFAGDVYAAWLSDIISKAFNLDFKDKTIIETIAFIFYQLLFDSIKELNEEYRQKLAVHTIIATNADSKFVLSLLDKIDHLNSIDAFCDVIKETTENIRLKDFNTGILLTLIKNSWFGINAKEILSVALEHPPTWIALVYTCLNERTYKNTIIYKYAEKKSQRGLGRQFLNNFRQLVESELTVSAEEFLIRDFE